MFSFTCAQRNKICLQFFPCCFFKCLFGDLNNVGATDGDGEGVLLLQKSDVSSISYSMPRRYVAGLFRPTPEGRINCNIPTRHAIIDLLPIKPAGSLFAMVT